MSQELINHSQDLKKLRDKGYDICIRSNHLLISHIPYLNNKKKIKYGTLVSDLELSSNKTIKPTNHQSHFIGDFPCDIEGKELNIKSSDQTETIAPNITKNYSFSSKPVCGYYDDYYQKMKTYIRILSAPAISIDNSVTAKTYRVKDEEEESVFNYVDTNSTKAEIENISSKLSNLKIAIIGLGGTGSYILDFVAKTKVQEIHIYDGDIFMQHSAFRAPGAASENIFDQCLKKVDYLDDIYSKMHKYITPHDFYINEDNIDCLRDLDFIFISIDKGEVKKTIFGYLEKNEIPFIDAGIGIEKVNGSLFGSIRTTTSTNEMRNHIQEYSLISFENNEDDDYSTNIQISELNALSATLAIIKWKKLYGFYVDHFQEHNSSFNIGGNRVANRFTNS